MESFFTYETALGPVTIGETDGALTGLHFGAMDLSGERRETALLKETCKQLGEYFSGKRRQFDLPVAPKGTAFQQKVWASLRQIPYGETVTYKDLARAVGNEKACRAVGMANHRNPIAIIIPCHRVIGSDGRLTGYAGGLEYKQQLLDLEKQNGGNHDV